MLGPGGLRFAYRIYALDVGALSSRMDARIRPIRVQSLDRFRRPSSWIYPQKDLAILITVVDGLAPVATGEHVGQHSENSMRIGRAMGPDVPDRNPWSITLDLILSPPVVLTAIIIDLTPLAP